MQGLLKDGVLAANLSYGSELIQIKQKMRIQKSQNRGMNNEGE